MARTHHYDRHRGGDGVEFYGVIRMTRATFPLVVQIICVIRFWRCFLVDARHIPIQHRQAQ
jgi:hypothetical protein